MKKKRIIALAGIISTVLGITFTLSASFQGTLWLAIIASMLIVAGLVLLAIAFED